MKAFGTRLTFTRFHDSGMAFVFSSIEKMKLLFVSRVNIVFLLREERSVLPIPFFFADIRIRAIAERERCEDF